MSTPFTLDTIRTAIKTLLSNEPAEVAKCFADPDADAGVELGEMIHEMLDRFTDSHTIERAKQVLACPEFNKIKEDATADHLNWENQLDLAQNLLQVCNQLESASFSDKLLLIESYALIDLARFVMIDEIAFAYADKRINQADKTPMCGRFTEDEVLPNEEGNCSLCDSSLNEHGECQYTALVA